MSVRRSRRAAGRTEQSGERMPRSGWRLVLARPEAVPVSWRRFTARARRHRLRMRTPLLVLAGVLALAVTGGMVLYHTSLFSVRSVRVEGASLLSPGAVRRAAAVPEGSPLAGVDLGAVRERVGGLAAVRSVRAYRDWPDAIVVQVTERAGVAAVPAGGGYHIVDRTGMVFRTVASRPERLPVVVLAHPAPRDESTRAALAVLRALTPKLRSALRRLECPRPTRLLLVLRSGLRVVWGDSSHSARKAAAATALLGRGGHTVDVSAPDLVTVR